MNISQYGSILRSSFILSSLSLKGKEFRRRRGERERGRMGEVKQQQATSN
jgi:hypothetical protein